MPEEQDERRRSISPGWRSSVSNPLPIRLVVVSWPPTMVMMRWRPLLLRSAVSVHFRRKERMDQPFPGMLLLFADAIAEIRRHVFNGLQDARNAIRIVLKVPEHFGKTGGPDLQLLVIVCREPQALLR